MEINIKNNSSYDSSKFEAVKQYLKFCQETSPLRTKINIQLVNETNQDFFNDTYMVGINGKSFSDVLLEIANKWVLEFSKQRKINTGVKEAQLIRTYFNKKFPSYNFL
jgi:hypothetical protein